MNNDRASLAVGDRGADKVAQTHQPVCQPLTLTFSSWYSILCPKNYPIDDTTSCLPISQITCIKVSLWYIPIPRLAYRFLEWYIPIPRLAYRFSEWYAAIMPLLFHVTWQYVPLGIVRALRDCWMGTAPWWICKYNGTGLVWWQVLP